MRVVYPFTAIVGQERMKRALILNAVNPRIGGVLIRGERGTAKSTAARALAALLPNVRVVEDCRFACDPDRPDTLCTECRERTERGEELPVAIRRTPFVDLPVSATEDRVVGTLDIEKAIQKGERQFEPGVLAAANRGLLYIDEVNLLEDSVTDAILDAAAQGFYTARHGHLNVRYRSSFLLIGSMNPEEGNLRPQIMDRFGLRAVVRGLRDPEMRYNAYEQAISHQRDPDRLSAMFAEQTLLLVEEIQAARSRLSDVSISAEAKEVGLEIIQKLKIESGRAEITLFEAARAYAAAEEREKVSRLDIEAVAVLALRMRQSKGMAQFMQLQEQEDHQLQSLFSTARNTQSLDDDFVSDS